MSEKDNGGPAFPSNYTHTDGRQFHEEGMELRDYFAAKAMQGICASEELRFTSAKRIASMAYQIADAMLAERQK